MSKLSKRKFKNCYGTIIEDMKVKEYNILYYPFFLFRRLLYAICLIFFYEVLNTQLALILIFTLVPVRLDKSH